MRVNITVEDSDTTVEVSIDNEKRRDTDIAVASFEEISTAEARRRTYEQEQKRIVTALLRNGADAALTALFGEGKF